MLPAVLLLAGGTICLLSLWQLRRWIMDLKRETAAAPRRLEAIVDELIATAEAASAAVAEKTEDLAEQIGRAERAAAELRTLNARPPAPARPEAPALEPRAVDVPEPAAAEPREPPRPDAPLLPEMHRRVYQLADSGQDVTAIARFLSLTKGEVQLILGLRRMH